MEPAHIFALGLALLSFCVLFSTTFPDHSPRTKLVQRVISLISVAGFFSVLFGAVQVFLQDVPHGWAYFSAGLMLVAATSRLYHGKNKVSEPTAKDSVPQEN